MGVSRDDVVPVGVVIGITSLLFTHGFPPRGVNGLIFTLLPPLARQL